MKSKKFKFYNQNTQQYEKHDIEKTLTFSVPDISAFGYMEFIKLVDKYSLQFFNAVSSDKPTLIKIMIDKKKHDDLDVLYFIGGRVLDCLIENQPLEREARLGIHPSLQGLRVSQLVLVKVSNNKMKTPVFSIIFEDITTNKEVMRVI